MFWESNPTNIKSPVFRGNTAITLITQKTLRDPILPMFSLCLSDVGGVGFFDLSESQCFSGGIGENSEIERGGL